MLIITKYYMCTWKKLWFYHSCSEHDVLALVPCSFRAMLRILEGRVNFRWRYGCKNELISLISYLLFLTATVPNERAMSTCVKIKLNYPKTFRTLKLAKNILLLLSMGISMQNFFEPKQTWKLTKSSKFSQRKTSVYEYFCVWLLRREQTKCEA